MPGTFNHMCQECEKSKARGTAVLLYHFCSTAELQWHCLCYTGHDVALKEKGVEAAHLHLHALLGV